MTTVPVIWLNFHDNAPNRGYWDQGLLEGLFDHSIWRPAGYFDFEHHEVNDHFDHGFDGGVVVIPGRQNAAYVRLVNMFLKNLDWALVILTGDEEGDFPVEKLEVENRAIKIWLMTPQPGRDYGNVSRFLGTGYPPGIQDALPDELPARSLDYFFAGQVTHSRREDCVKYLSSVENCDGIHGEVVSSGGFTLGLDQKEYWRKLASAKVAPAPGGPVSPDSFRAFEALEAGCVPLLDVAAGRGEFREFWDMVLPNSPIPQISGWVEAEKFVTAKVAEWPRSGNLVFSYWQRYKRDLAIDLHKTIADLSGWRGSETTADQVTVLVPTSAIKSHPSTAIIDETINSIRCQPGLEDCEIILMCDGVRDEQIGMEKRYGEYLQNLLWACSKRWFNVLPWVFDKHYHQGAMTRQVLQSVHTPTILFVEQDTPLIGEIEWDKLVNVVQTDEANIVRMHHEAHIHPEHEHLMLDVQPQDVHGVEMMRTVQWSQRPHIASTEFYRRIINSYFSIKSRTMIEDVMYGVLDTHWREEGLDGWEPFKLWIYTPSHGIDFKRSTHTDGRAGEPKFSMRIDYDGDPKWAPHRGVLE